MKYIKKYEKINEPYPIDIICNSYLETAIWTEELVFSETDFNLEGKTIYDFSDKAKEQAKDEIKWFIKNVIDISGYSFYSIFDKASYTSIGHDLWLTRNHHGTGFFDRQYDAETLDILKDLCDELGEIYLDIDSNDKICFDGYSEKYKTFDLEEYKERKKLEKEEIKYNL